MTLEEYTEGVQLLPMSDSNKNVVDIWLSAGTQKSVNNIEESSSGYRSIFSIASGDKGRIRAFGRIETGPDTLESGLQVEILGQCTHQRWL